MIDEPGNAEFRIGGDTDAGADRGREFAPEPRRRPTGGLARPPIAF